MSSTPLPADGSSRRSRLPALPSLRGPHADPSDRSATADPTDPVTPSREDSLVASASEVIGGPLGRHAIVGGAGAALAAMLVAVPLLVGAGVVERAHCLNKGWSAPDHFWHACYSDVPIVYQSSGLSAGVGPFSAESTLGQPLPTALVSWALATVTPGDGFLGVPLSPVNQARWYFALWSVAIVAMLVGLGAALVRGQARHPWRALHLASPALPFLALVSFEAVPVALAGVGIVAWGRRHRVVAGVLLALACLARPWAVLVLFAIFLLAVRTGRLRDAVPTLLTAAVVIGVALAGLALTPGGVGPYTAWWSASAGYGSAWFLASLAGLSWSSGLLSLVVCLGWVLALAAGAYLALASRQRPRLGELVLVMTVIVVLFGKAMPVQTGLWMLLLMAIVGVTWREHLAWAAVEIAYFVAVWLHIAASSDPNRGLPAGWYSVFVVARVVAWAWIGVACWRRAVRRAPAVPLAVAIPADAVGGRPGVDAVGSAAATDAVVAADAAQAADTSAADADRSVRVVEADDLAGAFAGRADDTVVSFV